MKGCHNHEIEQRNEKRTLIVIVFTVIAMVAEIMYGYLTNSMSLLADGYHMGTHVLALSLTYIAYLLIRKFKNSPKFPNGTDKIGILAAYTSSIFLGITGIWIITEALHRLIKPINIQFNEALLVAFIGLFVNAVCILIMEGAHSHCTTEHCHEKEYREDYNYKAAYYHILADAFTSVLAIIALTIGKYFNIVYLDSLIGILGGILILKWAINLLKSTVEILIDMKHIA